MRHPLPFLILAAGTLACAPSREATIPFPPADALARAVRVLESFDYNVVEVNRDEGFARGLRAAELLAPGLLSRNSGDIVWEVTVHVYPVDGGARYRLESDALGDAGVLEHVDSRHMDRILAALADWRR